MKVLLKDWSTSHQRGCVLDRVDFKTNRNLERSRDRYLERVELCKAVKKATRLPNSGRFISNTIVVPFASLPSDT
jgi:hypothetical protein